MAPPPAAPAAGEKRRSDAVNLDEGPPAKKVMTSLEQLRVYSQVVADTGDFEQIVAFKPQDATTNPSLLLQASALPAYQTLVEDTIKKCKESGKTGEPLVEEICELLAIKFGCEILKIVPGLVSTEVDADLSFDTEKSLAKARRIIKLYEENGYGKDRILIKLASTWEGCQAAKILEAEGIHCNMTLLFHMAQARAAAEAGATLISPFVGRILDWHKKADPTFTCASGNEDPGVLSVRSIYSYYKSHGFKTIVMGASFRNIGEIIALAGCDKLTISPKLLDELAKVQTPVSPVLTANTDESKAKDPLLTEAEFRWMMNEDPMATEKLAEGIRNFNADMMKLKTALRAKL